MLTPPPPYSRFFPTHFIEVPSDSEDEGTPPSHQSKLLTTIKMTQGYTPYSTGSRSASTTHQAFNAHTSTTSDRSLPFGSSGSTALLGCGPLLPSSMPDLQPLAEAPQYRQVSAIWPSTTRALDSTSPQASAAVQARRAPTPTPVRSLASAQAPGAHSPTSTINSSPSALLGISNAKIDKIVADALDRYLSNQRPGMRATRVNTNGSYEDNSTIEFHDMGSPIAPWFAVTRGRRPGIYHDLQEALGALGPSKHSRLEFCKSEADAAVLFLRALNSSGVGVVQNGKMYTIGPGMPLV